jgi:hypothetical protein
MEKILLLCFQRITDNPHLHLRVNIALILKIGQVQFRRHNWGIPNASFQVDMKISRGLMLLAWNLQCAIALLHRRRIFSTRPIVLPIPP